LIFEALGVLACVVLAAVVELVVLVDVPLPAEVLEVPPSCETGGAAIGTAGAAGADRSAWTALAAGPVPEKSVPVDAAAAFGAATWTTTCFRSAAIAANCALLRPVAPAMMTTVESMEPAARAANCPRVRRTPLSDCIVPCQIARALGADGRAARVRRTARLAPATDRGVARLEQMLDLTELGVDALELRGLGHQDIHPHVIPDRHLVEEATELGLQDREALDQALALCTQIGSRRRRQFRSGRLSSDPKLQGSTVWSGRPFCAFT
jgi:hypothetical protein